MSNLNWSHSPDSSWYTGHDKVELLLRHWGKPHKSVIVIYKFHVFEYVPKVRISWDAIYGGCNDLYVGPQDNSTQFTMILN